MSFQQNSSFDKTNNEEVCDVCFAMFIFRVCYQVVIFVVQFTGNSLIVWTIVSTPSLHSTCMVFICNLAIADFLSGLFVMPLAVVKQLYALQYVFLHTVNRACLGFAYTFCTASLFNLGFMSIDRCMITIKPLKYKVFMTPAKVKTVIIIIWFLSIVAGFFEGFKILTRQACFLVTLSAIVLVYLVILVSYGIIFKEVKKQTKVRAQIVASAPQQNFAQRASDQKLAKTIVLVIGVFSVCWSIFTYSMLNPPIKFNAKVYHTTWGRWYMWGTTFTFTSTAANPVIYFYRNSSLRIAAKTLLNNKILQKWNT